MLYLLNFLVECYWFLLNVLNICDTIWKRIHFYLIQLFVNNDWSIYKWLKLTQIYVINLSNRASSCSNLIEIKLCNTNWSTKGLWLMKYYMTFIFINIQLFYEISMYLLSLSISLDQPHHYHSSSIVIKAKQITFQSSSLWF